MGTNRVVIVTGGASGIGLAASKALLRDGWSAVIVDVVPATLEAARAEFSDEELSRIRLEQLDVTDETAVAQAVVTWDTEFGPIRGLVNSAGIGKEVPFFDTTTDLFRRILDINLVGTFVIAREAAKCMRAHSGGSIVNISSVAGVRGSVGRSAYGSSKAGVMLLTQVMAVELAEENIRVNAVAPGPIETPLVKVMHSDVARARWLRSVPQRRYAAPEEVAGTVAFLLDESKASYITGQIICVDGGFSAGGLLPS